MRGSMPLKFKVRNILRTLEQAKLENKLPIWDDGRMIVEEELIALKDEEIPSTLCTGAEKRQLKQERKRS